MKTLVRVDTRAREREVACERETRQLPSLILTAIGENVAEAKGAELADECYQEETFLYVWYSR